MATSNVYTKAPYVILPGGNALKGVTGVQDSINVVQSMLEGGVIDKYESPSNIVKTRQETFTRNVEFLNNVVGAKTYEGFVDSALIKDYITYARTTYKAESFVLPADVYGAPMTYNSQTGGFQLLQAPTVVTPVAPTVVAPAVPTYTVTLLDPSVTATEGQDLVMRFKLDTKNHNGVSFRPSFTNLGNQFVQADVVGAETRSNYIFPDVRFTAGSDYAEIRLQTVDDTMKETDEAVRLEGGASLSSAYKLNFVGASTVTLQDNDWAATSVTNVTINGNNNNVNVLNNFGTITVDNRTYVDIAGDNNSNVLAGTDRDDWIKGLFGDDTLSGGAGSDVLTGNQGNDTLSGGTGTDTLWGGFGDDIIIGNQDDDILYGNDGADVLWGGFGNDMLINNTGNDIVYGNAGADSFVLCAGQDTFKDFNLGEGDKILVFADPKYTIGQSAQGYVEINRGDNKTTLEGVTFAGFDASRAIQFMG
jgi:hypothetical protein